MTGAAIPAVAFALGILALPACALLGYRLARRAAGPWLSAVFVAAALAPQATLEVFASGMETPLYLVGILAALELACRGKDAAAFGVAAGLFFVHPDGAGLAAAMLGGWLLTRGTLPWKAVTLGVLPAAAGCAALGLAYGSPLPQSVLAKRAAYAMPPFHALQRLEETVLDTLVAFSIPAPPVLIVLAGGAVLGLALVGGRSALRRLPVLVALLFAALYVVAFALANPLVFPWYRPPLALATAFVVAACAARLARPARAAVAAALALAAASHAATFAPYDPSGREEVYARAAAQLRLDASAKVAAPEIGALGWATRARVVDAVGLVSPEALRWIDRPLAGGGTIPPGLLRGTDADALVALDRFLDPALAADPHALDGWTEIARLPARAFGGAGTVLVYRRAR